MRLLISSRLALGSGIWLLSAIVLPCSTARAQERETVGTCLTNQPALLRRTNPDGPWQFVKDKDAIHAGDLLLGGGGPTVVSANGAVALSLTGDLSATSSFPVIETAVVLHSSKEADLDISLERGAVAVTNRKESGAAVARFRFADRSGEIVLKAPGTKAVVEVYGRWPPGSRFSKTPKPGAGPAMGLAVLIVKGEAELRGKTKHFMMTAPPGPSLLVAPYLSDDTATPRHLDALPPWAGETEGEREKTIKAALVKLREHATAKSIGEALDEFAASDEVGMRRLAVLLMGALDDLPRLGQTLRNTKHLDVWENGILALRHFLGRGPGQDTKLYKGLTEVAKYPPAEAQIFIDLLHGFSDEQLTQPETYELLSDYLHSDRPSIRALAYWHLVRLVPDGKKIAFNPLAAKEEREAGVKEWSKLVPAGKVPGQSKPGEK